MHKEEQRGFTLLELLLSIGLIALLGALSLPVYRSFQVRTDVDITALETAHSLRRAQVLAQAVQDDSTWGVRVEATTITLFKGASYATRDTAFDEVFEFPATIVRSGTQEAVFDRVTGEPNTTGSFTFTSLDGDARTVQLNAKGAVSY